MSRDQPTILQKKPQYLESSTISPPTEKSSSGNKY